MIYPKKFPEGRFLKKDLKILESFRNNSINNPRKNLTLEPNLDKIKFSSQIVLVKVGLSQLFQKVHSFTSLNIYLIIEKKITCRNIKNSLEFINKE